MGDLIDAITEANRMGQTYRVRLLDAKGNDTTESGFAPSPRKEGGA